ncbi:PREDICTED: uncharacterized protein LOC109206290 [Nicotiana attenuata]|uniref:DUF599 domain-containing protein n=1 Tax=Nicotiana attenuata TaxID=49451 RepID=A0A314KVB1_NICAT|nr:PREDICTED: uncharacterized protein LOC109206290 [Nicotiana attenuata]OIT33202.1 hypothetical protein A4A49_07225 [Nicotiana attenuata]
MGAISFLDTILVPLSLFITIGYHFYLWHHLKHKPSRTTIGMNMLKKRSWLRELNQGNEKKGTLAVQSLRNTLMETILTATITMIITLALAALTNNTYNVRNLFTSAFFGSQTGKIIVLKYGSATIFLLASFLSSSLALSYLIDANFLVNALGEFSINPMYTETLFERGFTLAFVGDRVLCMAFPLLLWMFGPVPVVVSSLALVWGLHERDFAVDLSRTMSKSCT